MGITEFSSDQTPSTSGAGRLQQRWHRWVLDRCVLRPSRHPLDPVEQWRCRLTWDDPLSSPLECFVHLDPRQDHATFGETARIDQRSRSITQFGDISRPDVLMLKFPGTAGRAERSTRSPADLLQVWSDSRHTGQVANQPTPATEVWTWNPPGYGGSPGRARLSNYVAAAERFARLVSESRADSHSQIWLVGNSLGCLPALALARRASWSGDRQVRLWLRNPPDLANVIRRVARRWYAHRWMTRVTRTLPSELCSIRTAEACQAPAVFLMSELDTLVPPEVQRTVHDAYGGAARIVSLAGIDHDGVLDDQHLHDVVSAAGWLYQQTN